MLKLSNKKITIVSTVVFSIVCIVLSILSLENLKYNYINNLEREVSTTNKQKDFTIKIFSAEAFLDHVPDGGGELHVYIKNEKIKKIVESIGFSTGVLDLEYYFNDKEELIYVYEKEETFPWLSQEEIFDYTSSLTTFEGQYYFKNEKLIQKNEIGKRNLNGVDDDKALMLISRANYLVKKATSI